MHKSHDASALLTLVVIFANLSPVTSSYSSPIPSCTAACVINVKRSFSSIIGARGSPYLPSPLLAPPFHHILAANDDLTNIYRQTKWTCFSINSFDACLKECSPSHDRSNLLSSIGHWLFYCDLVKKPTKQVLDYMRCERAHLRRARANCSPINVNDLDTSATGLENFCLHFERYQQCFHRERPECPEGALELKHKMEVALQQTYERLMHKQQFSLPGKCTAWRKQPPEDVQTPENVQNDEREEERQRDEDEEEAEAETTTETEEERQKEGQYPAGDEQTTTEDASVPEEAWEHPSSTVLPILLTTTSSPAVLAKTTVSPTVRILPTEPDVEPEMTDPPAITLNVGYGREQKGHIDMGSMEEYEGEEEKEGPEYLRGMRDRPSIGNDFGPCWTVLVGLGFVLLVL